MLAQLVLNTALTAAVITAPAVAPSPNSSPTPELKTIATVRATSRCAAIITHANSAISGALSDDQIIGQTITRLRLTNLDDGNPLDRKHGLDALGDLAKNLMQQSRAADDEVKRLRKLAAESKDPQEGKALKAFADELGGALWSQQKVARDLNGFLAYTDFRDMTAWDEGQQKMNEANYGVADPLAENSDLNTRTPVSNRGGIVTNGTVPPMVPFLGHDPNEADATQQAKWAADDFQNRIPVIMRDENLAAGKVDGAIQGC